MQLKYILTSIITLLFAACAATSTVNNTNELTLTESSKLFHQWFAGEFDNNEQVWQQGVDEMPEADQHEHIHHIFLPVEAENIGTKTYFVKQYMDNDKSKIYRMRLYNFTEDLATDSIKLTIYTFLDESKYKNSEVTPALLNDITSSDLKTSPGCEVYWRFKEQYFEGTMIDKACFFYSERSNKNIYITDTLRLSDSEIWIGDKAYDEQGNKIFGRDEQHKNRKVSYYKGWASYVPSKVIDGSTDDEWKFISLRNLHNEGDTIALIDKNGVDTGYSIELSKLTYQNTNTAILKLGLIDNSTDKTITYIWGDPEAPRLGMNLRWMQVGLTKTQQSYAQDIATNIEEKAN